MKTSRPASSSNNCTRSAATIACAENPRHFDRVSLMFLIGKNDAYWIHAWKKSKLNNTKEVTLAKSRAEQLWASLSKG